MLELSHIDKYYNPGSVNEMCLFQDFNLTIPDSQFVSVVGSNGSGKTSMLNLICGSISADAGKVIVNGTDITGQKEYMRHRKNRQSIPEPFCRDVPEYDGAGKYGDCGSERKRLWIEPLCQKEPGKMRTARCFPVLDLGSSVRLLS